MLFKINGGKNQGLCAPLYIMHVHCSLRRNNAGDFNFKEADKINFADFLYISMMFYQNHNQLLKKVF